MRQQSVIRLALMVLIVLQAVAAMADGTGILLVSHGSRSAQWRGMLEDLEVGVRDTLLAQPGVVDVRTAFMEYTEPSIATGLKALDAQGCDRIILVPLLLTVSSHTFDDIPTIYGAKADAVSLEHMRTEGIEIYKPRARVQVTPTLDYPGLLQQNLARRALALSEDPSQEALVIVAYGSESYDEEWHQVFSRVSGEVAARTGISPVTYAWCGHIVRYKQEPTVKALETALSQRDRVLVLPALVARDAYFQQKIIGGAVASLKQSQRIIYTGDSILPDATLSRWIIETVIDAVAKAGDAP
jgi:hypothetical protein